MLSRLSGQLDNLSFLAGAVKGTCAAQLIFAVLDLMLYLGYNNPVFLVSSLVQMVGALGGFFSAFQYNMMTTFIYAVYLGLRNGFYFSYGIYILTISTRDPQDTDETQYSAWRIGVPIVQFVVGCVYIYFGVKFYQKLKAEGPPSTTTSFSRLDGDEELGPIPSGTTGSRITLLDPQPEVTEVDGEEKSDVVVSGGGKGMKLSQLRH